MTDELELEDGCELIHQSSGIKIFYDKTGIMRSVFDIDSNEDPLPQSDPNRFGYALVAINFVDPKSGFAICEVVHLQEFLAGVEDWGAEVVAHL